MRDRQYNEGVHAYYRGSGVDMCPYAPDTPAYESWVTGWNSAREHDDD